MNASTESPSAQRKTDAGTGAGGVDWLTTWRAMVSAEQAQSAAVDGRGEERASDRWAGQGERYANATSRASQLDAFMQRLLVQLRPSDTVLDIGAGAGRHTVFLAPHVAQVIAVERSPTMRRHLKRPIAERQITNVQVVAEPWPDADVSAADITICSHVIYGVRDIGPFLQRMDAITHRGCFIVAGFRQPSYVLASFWEAIYGELRLPLPGALECLNALYQLGIPAELGLLPASRYTFADEVEALADLRWRLRLAVNPDMDAAIRRAMDEHLVRTDLGCLSPRNQPKHTALISWTPGESKVQQPADDGESDKLPKMGTRTHFIFRVV